MPSGDSEVDGPEPGDVTVLLGAVARGEPGASDRLLPLIYDELRILAASRLRSERSGQTLQPTALVHEAYLRLVGGAAVQWQNHAHFFGAAALAMKRILIDRARRRHAEHRARASATIMEADGDPESVDLLALDGALARLGEMDGRLSQVVHLRFFAGLSVEQTAEVIGASSRTVKRDWSFARAWLFREMSGRAEPES